MAREVSNLAREVKDLARLLTSGVKNLATVGSKRLSLHFFILIRL